MNVFELDLAQKEPKVFAVHGSEPVDLAAFATKAFANKEPFGKISCWAISSGTFHGGFNTIASTCDASMGVSSPGRPEADSMCMTRWPCTKYSVTAAAVFTSTASMHGGQEATLVSMMMPLLHHGMVIVGLPYTEPDLNATRSGGTPYGATHVSGTANDRPVTDEEARLAFALGRRLAGIARRLAG